MSFAYEGFGLTAAQARPADRLAFIRRTYSVVALAIAAFVGLEAILLNIPAVWETVGNLFAANRMAWLGVMVLFIGGNYVAHSMANSQTSIGMQWAGLSLGVVLWTIMFLPILMIAEVRFPGQQVPLQAGGLTLLIFGGLTAAVFVSGKDFSFLRTGLMVGSFAALGVIVFALLFGASLGLWFSFLMVALACGYIIYDTSNIMHHYGTQQHVAAALALFSSIAMLFWYILRIFLSRE